MKRLDLLIAVFVIVSVLTFVWFWKTPQWKEQKNEPSLKQSINQNAKIADNGNPLPSVSDEDFTISVQSKFQHPEILRYDHDNQNWQIENFNDSAWQKIRWVDNKYFIFNHLDRVWDEIGKKIIEKNTSISEIEKDPQFYFLPTNQLSLITDSLEAAPDEPCQTNRICAVWYLQNEQSRAIAIYSS